MTYICQENPRLDGQPWEPWEGNGPCQECGTRNVLWFADSSVWNAVVGSDVGLILCPTCFIIKAFEVGYNPIWKLVPDYGSTFVVEK